MNQVYRDREAAGAALAQALERYRGARPLILGIPRGGVPVAAVVAHGLATELDIVVARKLGAPGDPELAIGAVTANGGCLLNEEAIQDLAVPRAYVAAELARKRAEASAREANLRASRAPAVIEGRTVIVDDGLATGATMRAAVRSVRNGHPGRLVVAVPVGAPESCDVISDEVDELICLQRPAVFLAVGAHYEHFEPVADETVRRLLLDATRNASEPAKAH